MIVFIFAFGIAYGDKVDKGKVKPPKGRKVEKHAKFKDTSVMKAQRQISSHFAIGHSVITARGTPHRLDNIEQDIFTSADKEGLMEAMEAAFDNNDHSGWQNHPSDERRQGNLGKPEMLPPYGMDKSPDRVRSGHRRPVSE